MTEDNAFFGIGTSQEEQTFQAMPPKWDLGTSQGFKISNKHHCLFLTGQQLSYDALPPYSLFKFSPPRPLQMWEDVAIIPHHPMVANIQSILGMPDLQ